MFELELTYNHKRNKASITYPSIFLKRPYLPVFW